MAQMTHMSVNLTPRSLQLYEEARVIAERIEIPQPRSTAGRIRSRVQVLRRSALASKVFALIQTAKVCKIHDPFR